MIIPGPWDIARLALKHPNGERNMYFAARLRLLSWNLSLRRKLAFVSSMEKCELIPHSIIDVFPIFVPVFKSVYIEVSD